MAIALGSADYWKVLLLVFLNLVQILADPKKNQFYLHVVENNDTPHK